jgi:bifunctional non-homologous end joining protein LigD
VWSRDKNAYIEYCVVNELASLLWAVNLGSIELHSSLHLRDEMERPTAIAFDLDPGEGVGLLECGEVAMRVRELFTERGREAHLKTSGSKGLQVYVPTNRELKDSVRAKERPTVSTPIRWSEQEGALDARDSSRLVFEMGDVLARVDGDGDLFRGT